MAEPSGPNVWLEAGVVPALPAQHRRRKAGAAGAIHQLPCEEVPEDAS